MFIVGYSTVAHMRSEASGEESTTPAELVAACVRRARDAMDDIAGYDQEQADAHTLPLVLPE